jgi:hypothetical protein
LNKAIYVRDDLFTINVLAQKRRDIDLDAKSMEIEELQQSGLIANLQHIMDAEQERLEKLGSASVTSSGPGAILTVGAATGRHVSPGDTIASVVDCDKRFVVAIFSYPQGESMKPGTHVRIEGGAFPFRRCYLRASQDERQGRRALRRSVSPDRAARIVCDCHARSRRRRAIGGNDGVFGLHYWSMGDGDTG